MMQMAFDSFDEFRLFAHDMLAADTALRRRIAALEEELKEAREGWRMAAELAEECAKRNG